MSGKVSQGSQGAPDNASCEEGFTVQIVLGQDQTEKAFTLSLGKNARKALEGGHQFPDGRWLSIRIEYEQDVKDVEQLLIAKTRPSKAH